ncbi:MAG: FAD-dependent monooxygenase [Mucilaginibacter sp.]|uniref:FAD-dependent monooxygenase n=1 Tax=Mucilaginibacter sp. TaxID=1882438 RepID=UPI00319F5783
MENLPVLIVGAGPTGLTLACELVRRGINVRIIDKAPQYHRGSRAKGIQPRSLEIMNDLGLADAFAEAGISDLIIRQYNGAELIGDIRREVFLRSDTRFPQGLILPQWKVEEILRGKLKTFGIEIETGTELLSFDHDDQHVIALLRSDIGNEKLTCAYLVGCDGGKSTVRKMAGITFEGETHEDEKMYVGDVEIEGLVPDAWHIWLSPELGFAYALCPFKGTDSWQVQAVAVPDAAGDLAEPGLGVFRKLFAERTGMTNVVLKNETWASLYRVNVRMANRYREGRVFIAGDAAHAHTIAGGLGMNTGIQDAYNLGWKLALVLQQSVGESLLNTYEEERRPIAAWTLKTSSQRQKITADSIKSGGNGRLQKMGSRDTTQLDLNYRSSSLSVDIAKNSKALHAGDRSPDMLLSSGSWLSDFYRGTHFSVVLFTEDHELTQLLSLRFNDAVKTILLNSEPAAYFGDTQNMYVIRPDGHIGMIAPYGFNEELVEYLDSFLSNNTGRN